MRVRPSRDDDGSHTGRRQRALGQAVTVRRGLDHNDSMEDSHIMSDLRLEPVLSIPSGFRYGEVSSLTALRAASSSVPSLGPLAAFTGTFRGNGFNCIFRPDSSQTPTKLPVPVSGSDNVLELNLTEETLSFSPSLGSVPNRGEVQGDIFLNGVPYLQTINDVTVPSQPIGIHFEPGLWMAVPATKDPAEGPTLVRMASIPHGTTIMAQGKAATVTGKPDIKAIDITPFTTGSPTVKTSFDSQTATKEKQARIPQDLASFIKAGTITQKILSDPTTLLRDHIAAQTITSTTVITISTKPAEPLFGGGTDNIAFLLGDKKAAKPNAQALEMDATFWIETVEFSIEVPVWAPGQPPLTIPAETGAEGQPVPEFLVTPPVAITAPRTIKVSAHQIQYAQQVFLNFGTLTWPHVSVATLVPASPIPVPASAFS